LWQRPALKPRAAEKREKHRRPEAVHPIPRQARDRHFRSSSSNHTRTFAMSTPAAVDSTLTAASVLAGAGPQGTPREVLSFKLGAEEYGIDILKVQEIRGYEQPTRIANTPGFMKGVVNLRGVIVPIVDMRVRFALDDVKYDAFTVVIILNVIGRTVGIVVDSVSDVLELRNDQIKSAPEFNGQIDSAYITGLGTVKTGDTERMLILMDIEQMLSSAEMGLMDMADVH
jgi:purine-binding chemotaxis protein CheW